MVPIYHPGSLGPCLLSCTPGPLLPSVISGLPFQSTYCACPIPECYTEESVPALRVQDLSYNSSHSHLASDSSLSTPGLPFPPFPSLSISSHLLTSHSKAFSQALAHSVSPCVFSFLPTFSTSLVPPSSPLKLHPWPQSLDPGTLIQLMNSPSQPPLQPRASQFPTKGG